MFVNYHDYLFGWPALFTAARSLESTWTLLNTEYDESVNSQRLFAQIISILILCQSRTIISSFISFTRTILFCRLLYCVFHFQKPNHVCVVSLLLLIVYCPSGAVAGCMSAMLNAGGLTAL